MTIVETTPNPNGSDDWFRARMSRGHPQLHPFPWPKVFPSNRKPRMTTKRLKVKLARRANVKRIQQNRISSAKKPSRRMVAWAQMMNGPLRFSSPTGRVYRAHMGAERVKAFHSALHVPSRLLSMDYSAMETRVLAHLKAKAEIHSELVAMNIITGDGSNE